MSRRPSDEERKLMRAMGLKEVRQLDKMLREPVSGDAESHEGSPDEDYDRAEEMYRKSDLWQDAQQRFEALLESEYLN
jgi:hypothetical protein